MIKKLYKQLLELQLGKLIKMK